jgi:lipopolysaccharide biosynthesis glycosyltransferase
VKISQIYIATHKHDMRFTRICVASIRYWYPEIPIYLIKDYFNGDFSTEEMERVWNVKIFETPNHCFGWGMSKLEPVFSEQGKRFLILDSDTVFAGRVLDWLEQQTEDFVVSLETQPPQRLKEIYFDLAKLSEFDPQFHFPGTTFNTGQYVATGGILKRDDFDAVNWTTTPPSLKYPEIFKNGDQGVLNYVLSKKAEAGQVTIGGIPFMKYGLEEIGDLDLSKIAENSPYPFVIHWAGLKRPQIKAMIRSDILLFFEDYYYSKIRFGKTINRYRVVSELIRRAGNKALAKTERASRSTRTTPTDRARNALPEPQPNVSVTDH